MHSILKQFVRNSETVRNIVPFRERYIKIRLIAANIIQRDNLKRTFNHRIRNRVDHIPYNVKKFRLKVFSDSMKFFNFIISKYCMNIFQLSLRMILRFNFTKKNNILKSIGTIGAID